MIRHLRERLARRRFLRSHEMRWEALRMRRRLDGRLDREVVHGSRSRADLVGIAVDEGDHSEFFVRNPVRVVHEGRYASPDGTRWERRED